MSSSPIRTEVRFRPSTTLLCVQALAYAYGTPAAKVSTDSYDCGRVSRSSWPESIVMIHLISDLPLAGRWSASFSSSSRLATAFAFVFAWFVSFRPSRGLLVLPGASSSRQDLRRQSHGCCYHLLPRHPLHPRHPGHPRHLVRPPSTSSLSEVLHRWLSSLRHRMYGWLVPLGTIHE